MDDISKRLAGCFSTVFPNVPEKDFPGASQESIAAWDSVASITLVRVVEDEFGIEIDLDQLAELDSFAKIREYVESAPRSA